MKINKELCGICMACATVCPRSAINITEHEAVVDNQICNDCGICLKVCPVGAVSIENGSTAQHSI